MANLCTNCGTELPRNDARFCAICGTLVATHPKNTQLAELLQDEPEASPTPISRQNAANETHKTKLREQVAQQPPTRVTNRENESTPTWMSKLDEKPVSRNIPGRPKSVQRSNTQNANAIWTPPVIEQHKPQYRNHANPASVSEKPSTSQEGKGRELHVKVWTEEIGEPFEEEYVSGNQDENEITHIPTMPLLVEHNVSEQPTTAIQDVEHVDTTPLPPTPKRATDAPVAKDEQLSIPDIKTVQMPMATAPFPASNSVEQHSGRREEQQPVQSSLAPLPVFKPAASIASRPALPKSTIARGRTTNTQMLILLVGALVIVIALFSAMWLWLVHPFSVAPVTQPQQRMADSNIGVSFLYPTGWTGKSNPKTNSIHLYDSSNTAQMTISKVIANTTDGGMQYLKAQATQQGLTAIKEGQALTFAGTSWQQIQGTIAQKGANYTEVMLASIHNGHLFLLIQEAPQAVYADEEASVFSIVHSSLQFS